METNTPQKTAVTLNLSAAEISRLIDIVNDKSDGLFDKLHTISALAAVAKEPSDRKAAEERAHGLRDSLRFWDGIERQLKVTHRKALCAEGSE